MQTDPIIDVIARWHGFISGETPGALEDLLADDVVFYSPIVYTPQQGKAVTTMYLTAAGATLGGNDAADGNGHGAGKFHYTKQVLAGDTAVLEFESSIEGKYLNGVDIIRCNPDGQIVEFRVMIRPLQAINAVHAQMKAALEAMQAG
ncbi:nuclear transport factor 2 family protein [Desertimonas flava]|uniref:nuclear transport factor 2 family protein n=1 Tax=Desertimonas flava TaxID=2064846 RepID=UPI000E3476D7|nr:nuclear transport factor 2 family protein [Desertimonas flava]